MSEPFSNLLRLLANVISDFVVGGNYLNVELTRRSLGGKQFYNLLRLLWALSLSSKACSLGLGATTQF